MPFERITVQNKKKKKKKRTKSQIQSPKAKLSCFNHQFQHAFESFPWTVINSDMAINDSSDNKLSRNSVF